MKNVVVISPHPDDETLGCGGTLLKHKDRGDQIHWLNVTGMPVDSYTKNQIDKRAKEIDNVKAEFGFTSYFNLGYPTAKLDTVPSKELISKISEIFQQLDPEVIYLPFNGDIHSDHKIVSNAALSCTKWFRLPSIKKVLVYEVLSETEFQSSLDSPSFHPNVYVNIRDYLEKKIVIASIYSNEIGPFPFPRSEKTIRSLAAYRGSSSGFDAAEAFMLLKEIVD